MGAGDDQPDPGLAPSARGPEGEPAGAVLVRADLRAEDLAAAVGVGPGPAPRPAPKPAPDRA